MNALRRAWEKQHGPGSVVGLAPSAVAAQILADDLKIETENTAKWWEIHERTPARRSRPASSSSSTRRPWPARSRSTASPLSRRGGGEGAARRRLRRSSNPWMRERCVLDARPRPPDDAPELVDIHRFTNVWEKAASLGLRHGRTEVIDTYLRASTASPAETREAMVDAAYAAWRADRDAGRVACWSPKLERIRDGAERPGAYRSDPRRHGG